MKRSGNPFVDMGLCTIAALGEKDSIDEISIEDMEEIFNKYDIASANGMLKSFTMVFTNNTVLGQTAYKAHRIEMYRDLLIAFLKSIREMNGNKNKFICEICGQSHDFDINDIWNDIVTKYGYEPKENKVLGRDFFPLIGSLGNDAQALPSASRAVNICPLCLFAVNYIPLGTMLMKGRLICVESTSEVIMLEFIKDIVYENKNRISMGNREIIGRKESDAKIYEKFLKMFTRLQTVKRYEKLPDSVAIYLWLFSNSGTGADCDIIEIPNKPLQFIWEISRKSEDFKNEFLDLVSKDKAKKLFDAICYGEDYEGLYPKGKDNGVKPELYEYYQRFIVGKSVPALEFAKKVARNMLKGKDAKARTKLKKSDIFKEPKNRNIAEKAMFCMVMNGEANYLDYLELFNKEDKYLSVNTLDAYNTIMYYLYNDDAPDIQGEGSSMEQRIKSKNADKKIMAFAELYFNYYVSDSKGLKRGIDRFKKDILDNFKDFGEFKLREAFAKLAEIYDRPDFKFDYDGWLDFITDDEGNKKIYELLFQLRLAFAELYREYKKREESKV